MKTTITTLLLLLFGAITTTAQEQQGYLLLTGSNGKWAIKDSDIDRITIKTAAKPAGIEMLWYVIGSDVADGSWGFDVPTSRIPMYTESDADGILTYTGYFGTGQYGFKLVGNSWADQWGAMGFGYYTKYDGDNIMVPSPGYYTIVLNTQYDRLSIEPAQDLTSTEYTAVSISGSFNGWSDTQLERVPGTNSHDWYCPLSLNTETELKFKANNNWDLNWGGTAFPSGRGVPNGENIHLPAGNYIVLFNELTGHYRFYDPSNPTPTAYQPQTYEMTLTPGDTYVDFANFDRPTVQLFGEVQLPLVVAFELKSREVSVTCGNNTFQIGSNNIIGTEALKDLVESAGKMPGEREITVTVTYLILVNGIPEKYVGTTKIICLLPPLAAPPFLYFVGSTNGWADPEQKLAQDNQGVFRGFCYLTGTSGGSILFKFQQEAGNWDSQLNAGSFATIGGDLAVDAGDCFTVTAGEGVYYMEADLAKGTFSATKVQQMSIIGDFTGWFNDVDMTWDAERYCYKATSVGATTMGWKFRINHDWIINLGGTVEMLDYNDANINMDANTIELFPTRRDNDYIYCTTAP